MQFDLNRDINGAARDVQAAISAADVADKYAICAAIPIGPTQTRNR
jgi:hypothetical protein